MCFHFTSIQRYHYDHFHRFQSGLTGKHLFHLFGKGVQNMYKAINNIYVCTLKKEKRERDSEKARTDSNIEQECRSTCDIVQYVCVIHNVMGRAHKCFLANLPSSIFFLASFLVYAWSTKRPTNRPTKWANTIEVDVVELQKPSCLVIYILCLQRVSVCVSVCMVFLLSLYSFTFMPSLRQNTYFFFHSIFRKIPYANFCISNHSFYDQ